MCKTDNVKLLFSTGSSAWSSAMTKRGAMGLGWKGSVRGGISVYIELIHFVVQQKLTHYCKTIILQFFEKCFPFPDF